jgi:hypothetical protein
MGLALVLIVMGVLILTDRMALGYGLKEGWPWMVIALGIGGLFRNIKSLAAWITVIVGACIVGTKYYSINISVPAVIKSYFLPVLLIVIGVLWLIRYKTD